MERENSEIANIRMRHQTVFSGSALQKREHCARPVSGGGGTGENEPCDVTKAAAFLADDVTRADSRPVTADIEMRPPSLYGHVVMTRSRYPTLGTCHR